MRLSDHERAYFKACSDELLEHHLVQSMSRYEQHGTTNRLDPSEMCIRDSTYGR